MAVPMLTRTQALFIALALGLAGPLTVGSLAVAMSAPAPAVLPGPARFPPKGGRGVSAPKSPIRSQIPDALGCSDRFAGHRVHCASTPSGLAEFQGR